MSSHHQGTFPNPFTTNGERAFETAFPAVIANQAIADTDLVFAPRDRFFPGEGVDPRGYGPDDVFAPRQSWADSSSSQQSHYVQRHSQTPHHARTQHHPYASFDHANPHTGLAPSAHPHPKTAFSADAVLGAAASGGYADADPHGTRQVSRAACLSCRSAKRKCDGVRPVCGPCAQRGVSDDPSHPDGACVYVASKRGGPRFKGVRGREATKKVLDERERLRIEEEERTLKERAKKAALFSSESGNDLRPPGLDEAPVYALPLAGSSFITLPGSNGKALPQQSTPDRSASPGSDMHSYYSRMSSDNAGGLSPHTPLTPASARSDLGRDSTSDTTQSAGVFAFGHQREALFQGNYFRETPSGCGGLFDDLSAANLDVWQKLHGQHALPTEAFASFYQKLENLPKAGVLSSGEADEPIIDDFDMQSAHVDVTEASKSAAAVNSEQQARALLADYYELVYPGCPVMLPSGHLSSLAFHLSEDDSSALLASISSCVALQLPQSEVHRVVRRSMHLSDPDDKEANAGLRALENAPREEIALFHAKSAERLLLKKVAQLARRSENRGSHHQAGLTSTFAPDPELVRIKLVATHVLLSHYYYGITEQKRAFHHASQAWAHCQALSLDPSLSAAAAPSWFSSTQKAEWARRAYWASYTAATVMSCTGGFTPLSVTRNSAADLSLLPGAGKELASWKVLAKGAQFVSRAYSTLHDLEAFRSDPAHQLAAGHSQPRQHQQKWEAIFSRMQGIDNDVMNYVRHDSAWPDDSCFEVAVKASRRTALFDDENDTRLKRSLRIAGKLMTSGALIILHRTQAFANAKIFVSTTCGLPGALDSLSEGSVTSETAPPRAPQGGVEGANSPCIEATEAPVAGELSGHKHESLRALGEMDSDRATKRPRTRPGRSMSTSSRSSSGSDSGGAPSISGSSSNHPKKVALTGHGIPVLFSGGPFEPPLSLERCRFAASVMYTELPHICESTFQHGRRESLGLLPMEGLNLDLPKPASREEWSAPSLPPFSACSLVLAAYVFLMETLHAQLAARGSEFAGVPDAKLLEDSKCLEAPFLLNADPDRPRQIPKVQGKEALQLAIRLRHSITKIEHALEKFARAWDIAKSYVQEVSVLLEVNNSLFPGHV
ncbi:hypothetical protein ACQY0O_000256 [Thecaphora frezii]